MTVSIVLRVDGSGYAFHCSRCSQTGDTRADREVAVLEAGLHIQEDCPHATMKRVAETPIAPVRMPTEMRDAVKAKAKSEGTNLSAIVRAAMQDYLDGKWTP